MKLKTLFAISLSIGLFTFNSISFAAENASGKTSVTWWGHAAFQIITPKGVSIVIDPWLSNPINPVMAKGGNAQAAVKAVGKCDYILITHGHSDHLAEAVALAKATHAKLVTNYELSEAMVKVLGYPKDQAGSETAGNPGSELTIADGEVKVHFVQAIHSSGLDTGKDSDPQIYGGIAVGFVLEIKNGPTIYHSGDTALYSDMALIGKYFHPDLALVNIGGHFGMEPAQAADAALMTRAKLVVPMHFKTFPLLTQSADAFFRLLDARHVAHREIEPSKSLVYTGKTLTN